MAKKLTNTDDYIRNQKDRMDLKEEMSRFNIRRLTGILDNKYMELIDKGVLEPEDRDSDINDFEFEVELVIASIEEFRTKVVKLTKAEV